jgi:cell division protein FtsA
MLDSHLVVGVDVGTTKVCALVGEAFLARRNLDVLGVGMAPNRGMVSAAIVDPHAVASAVREAIRGAEQSADVQVLDVVCAVGGEHITSQTEIGAVEIAGRGAITQDHVTRAIEQGAQVQLPMGREVVYVSAREFSLDGEPGLRDPIGRSGQHLQADVRIITGATAARREIEECVRSAGVNAHQCALKVLATGFACLSEEERETGVLLVDLGGGTTELACFRRGALCYAGVLPLGGMLVTQDIATCLGTSLEDAERLKVAYARAMPEMADPEREVEYRDTESGELMSAPHSLLCEIVEARLEEILDLARERLMRAGVLSMAPSGIVLAGGGSQLPGVAELARHRFGGMLVRTARAVSIGMGMELVAGPASFTALGLALHAAELAREEIARRRALGPVRGTWLQIREALRLNH